MSFKDSSFDRLFSIAIVPLLLIGMTGCSNGSSALNPGPQPAISVSVFPTAQNVQVGTTQNFTATITNDSQDKGVTWSLSCTGICGALSPTNTSNPVTFTAPASMPASTVTLSATSNADPMKSGSATITITSSAPAPVSVTTWHDDNLRSGVNSQETALTPAAINSTSKFGKKFSCAVDSDIYAQPLYVPNLAIAGKGTRNAVFVATEKNTVYAFDADSNSNPCVPLWSVSLMNSGETPLNVTSGDGCSETVSPDIGITGTPVIDLSTQTLYAVSNSKAASYFQRLHALSLASGAEKFGGPLTIQATASGSGDANVAGMISFDPRQHLQRPGLLLQSDIVYVAWASYCDIDPYHGWVISFSATGGTLQKLSTFNDTPNGSRGGIWMSGAAPASDGTNIFVITGNGTFDANSTTTPNTDFGDSFLKLTSSLAVNDWFTPFNQASLDVGDTDVGGGGAVLLIDNPGGPQAHLLVGGGKEGKLYLLNRDNLGHFQSGSDSQIVQSFSVGSGIFSSPVFWNNTLYIAGSGSSLSAFAFNTIGFPGIFNPTAISRTSTVFGFPGATPALSSNGTANGIVWAIERLSSGPAILHAYDAGDLATELWSSSQAPGNRDVPGSAVKFTVPTIANGKVYIGTHDELDVYGLLP